VRLVLGPARLSVLIGLLASLALSTPALPAEPVCPPSATVPTPEALQEAARNAQDRGALWRFAKEGRHGYLYGTIHIANLDWAMPGPTVGKALRDAEVIAIEADPGDPATGAGMAAPQKSHEAPSLSPALLERLRERAARACEPWETLQTMPPLMMVTRLTLLDARWDGLHTDYSIEAVLAAFARKTGKSLALLETVATQRAAIVTGTPAEQAAEVERQLTALESGAARQAMAAIANAWARGDVDTLRRLFSPPDARATLERMAATRNPAIAARLDELHRGGQRVFAAAGILHMVGDGALQKLLTERGFTVERVPFGRR
jgi:uncharacterized protein YbaP (TraB family)